MKTATAPVRAPRSSPAPARPRHLAVVDPAARKRERRARIGVRCAVAAVVAAVLIVVGFHVMMAEGQLQLDRLDAATKTEQQRYEQLRLKYAQRSSPEAIIDRADRLGMIPATSQRYISVPGLSEHDSTDDGSGATASSLARDWEKVKQHLVERP
jgi:cell division protein FtsL